MDRFEKTLSAIDKICNELLVPYAVIGGVAVLIHNYRRTTKDVDVTLIVEIDEIEKVGKLLLKYFKSLYAKPIDFFEKYFVLPVIFEPTNLRIDFSAGVSEFDKSVIGRRKRVRFKSTDFYVCSLEDLILYKLIAARPQDIADVEKLFQLNKQAGIDKAYLSKVAKQFIDLERSDVFEKLNKYLQQYHL